MVASTLLFASMHAAIRHAAQELHPFQVAFFRNFFGLLVFLPVIMRLGVGFLRTDRLHLHALRAVMNVIAMLMFFTALTLIPLAKVTALSFTAPLFIAVLSVIILGERMRIRRWTATILGFSGMLVIVRPGMTELELGSILVIVSSAVWALTMILIKFMTRTESSLTITGYMSILLSILSLGPAIWVWRHPSIDAWIWLVFIGVVGTLAQLALAEAVKQADAGAIMPFDFLKLIWAAGLGYVLYTEIPDTYTWVGAAIIFASGSYIAYRESVVARQRRHGKLPERDG